MINFFKVVISVKLVQVVILHSTFIGGEGCRNDEHGTLIYLFRRQAQDYDLSVCAPSHEYWSLHQFLLKAAIIP